MDEEIRKNDEEISDRKEELVKEKKRFVILTFYLQIYLILERLN